MDGFINDIFSTLQINDFYFMGCLTKKGRCKFSSFNINPNKYKHYIIGNILKKADDQFMVIN